MPRLSSTFLCAVIAIALSDTPGVWAQSAPMAGSTANGDTPNPLRPAERIFLVESTEGGRTVAEISRLAVSQATASAVRDFAQQLAGDYGQINSALESLARRKSVPLPLAPTSFTDAYRELSLQPGSRFDNAFVRRTAATCQRQLRLCESAVADAKDADVRELAGNLLPTLRDHVNKATELLKGL